MGLGSLEAEREPHKTVPWLDAVTREHNIGAVIVYSEWFPTPPPSWVKLGELCLVIHPVEIASACTHYYTVPSSTPTTPRRPSSTPSSRPSHRASTSSKPPSNNSACGIC